MGLKIFCMNSKSKNCWIRTMAGIDENCYERTIAGTQEDYSGIQIIQKQENKFYVHYKK